MSRQASEGCAVFTLHGRLDEGTHTQVQAEFHHALAEHPDAVIFDVDDVTSAHRSTPGWFASMRRQAWAWPGIPWVLAGADTGAVPTMVRQDVGSGLRMFPTVAEAMKDVGDRDPRTEVRILLPPRPESARSAREFARTACHDWGLDALEWPTTLAASELVTNAVLHSGTSCEVVCAYDSERGELRLSVRDAVTDRPTRLDPGPDGDHGRGLVLVHELARRWGVLPTHDGGKLVWCLITVEDDDVSDRP